MHFAEMRCQVKSDTASPLFPFLKTCLEAIPNAGSVVLRTDKFPPKDAVLRDIRTFRQRRPRYICKEQANMQEERLIETEEKLKSHGSFPLVSTATWLVLSVNQTRLSSERNTNTLTRPERYVY